MRIWQRGLKWILHLGDKKVLNTRFMFSWRFSWDALWDTKTSAWPVSSMKLYNSRRQSLILIDGHVVDIITIRHAIIELVIDVVVKFYGRIITRRSVIIYESFDVVRTTEWTELLFIVGNKNITSHVIWLVEKLGRINKKS